MPQHVCAQTGAMGGRPHSSACPQHALLAAAQGFWPQAPHTMLVSCGLCSHLDPNLGGNATLVVAHAFKCESQNSKAVPRKGLSASSHVED